MIIFTSAANLVLTATVLAGCGSAKIIYAGVNSGTSLRNSMWKSANETEAGGEFAQQNLPGAFGTDYQFINKTAIDFFIKAGVNTIRLPFLLVDLFPRLDGNSQPKSLTK